MNSQSSSRNVLLLVGGQGISAIGNWVLAAALPVWVYQLTGSASILGAMVVAETVPTLLLGPLAGVLVDRWNRQYVLIIGNLLRAIAVLILLVVRSPEQIPIIFVVAFFNALVAAFTAPAQEALLPSLVSEDKLMQVNSLLTTAVTGAQFVGPALGGALITLAGPQVTFVLDSASFLVMGIAAAALRVHSKPIGAEEKVQGRNGPNGILHALLDGLRLIRTSIVLSGILLTWSLLMIAAGVVQAVLVPFVQDVLNGTDATYGYLLSIQGAGLIVGGVITMTVGHRLQPLRVFQVGLLLFAVTFVLLSAANLFWARVLIFGVGVAMAIVGVTEMTIFQQETPEPYRGRVLALDNFVAAFMLLAGAGTAGVLADLLGARLVFAGAAWLSVGAALLAFWVFRPERVAAKDTSSKANEVLIPVEE
jgi:MFS family permease